MYGFRILYSENATLRDDWFSAQYLH